ncbi:MAG TPA: oxygenase MpaB family protein [Candidatus Dormibacteraeota bacterium]|nr:oxygenase MpaB family protein [Candidatus Dormibacteraeota bacterium]
MREGLFPDDSVIRRVNRENVLMLGGGRALLMQLAHPKVAAGVDEHSDFRMRPLYRLRRTIKLTMAIVFGDRETALAAARSVNRAHAHVRGTGYSALDPDLLLWVHATLVDSALVTYETFVGGMSVRDREDFYQQMKLPGEILGIPRDRFPSSIGDFDDYVERMVESDELSVGVVARELGRLVVRPRVLRLPGPFFIPLELVTAGLLPLTLRDQYGLPWGRSQARIFRLFVIALPKLVAVTPPVLRVWPLPGHNVKLAADFAFTS